LATAQAGIEIWEWGGGVVRKIYYTGPWKLATIPLYNLLKSPVGAHVHKTTSDLYSPECNAFYAGKSITWASERGLGSRNLDFFGPQMALPCQLDAMSQGPKNYRAQPPPNCPRNGSAHIKSITYEAYKSGVHK
jgi:hypothetical protein